MEYQNAMAVDRNNLDEEAIQLPGWFGVVVEQEAIATDEVAALGDKMKVLQADINLMIRGWTVPQINMFYDLALTKITESVYTSLILIHPDVIELQNRIIKARHKATIYKAAARSMEKKGEMLKELSKLYAQGYYMRIETQAYKQPKVELLIKQVKAQLIERAKRELKPATPQETAAANLQARIDNQRPSEATPPAKTLKTSKTTPESTPEAPKRVRGQ